MATDGSGIAKVCHVSGPSVTFCSLNELKIFFINILKVITPDMFTVRKKERISLVVKLHKNSRFNVGWQRLQLPCVLERIVLINTTKLHGGEFAYFAIYIILIPSTCTHVIEYKLCN